MSQSMVILSLVLMFSIQTLQCPTSCECDLGGQGMFTTPISSL